MVVRTNIKCHTCNQAITLRVQLSHSEYEEMKFLCPHCKEDLSIEVILNKKDVSFEIKAKQNCIKTVEEGYLLYLSTEVITSNQIAEKHDTLPSLNYMHQIQSYGSISAIPKTINKDRWELIYRAYNQYEQKNYDFLEKLLSEYCDSREIKEKYSYRECLYDHLSYTIGEPQRNELFHLYEIISIQDHQKLVWLRNYIRQRIKVILPNANIVINEIYNQFDLHYPFLICIRSGINQYEELHYILNDFNSIKQTYGNIFEVFAELIEILACINNILCDRDYDVFKTMNLTQYIKIDKAKRLDPFRDNSNLMMFCSEFDSNMRNASHHGHIQLNKSLNRVEYYTTNSENIKSISIKEYIYKINMIFINSMTILCVWLFITRVHD